MRTKVTYEWTLEIIQEGDIVDSNFFDAVSDFDKADLAGNDLGLVRYEGNENEGTTNQLWAYVKDGKLPEYFSNANMCVTGYKVPVKYHTELSKYLS
jgi:predicted membrane-bound dolichyl-phosphate-mannose-protein mannosyltransferase